MVTLTSSLQRRRWTRSGHQRCLETDWSCSSSRAWTSNSDPWKRMTMRLTWTWLVPIPSNWKVGQRCSRTWSPPSTSSPSGSQSSHQQLLCLQSLYENYNISPWVWWILGNTCKKCITMRKMRVFLLFAISRKRKELSEIRLWVTRPERPKDEVKQRKGSPTRSHKDFQCSRIYYLECRL